MNSNANCFFEFDWISWFHDWCLSYYIMINEYMLIFFIHHSIKNCEVEKLGIFSSTETRIAQLFAIRLKVNSFVELINTIMISRHYQSFFLIEALILPDYVVFYRFELNIFVICSFKMWKRSSEIWRRQPWRYIYLSVMGPLFCHYNLGAKI